MPQVTRELDSLDGLMKTPVLKRVEAVIHHLVYLPDQGVIHLLQQVVTRVIPLFGGYLYESLRDNVQIVSRKFSRSSPVNR